MKKTVYYPFGFTLIELIVVIAITIILSGVGLAGYFQFSQRQAAMNDARNFSTMLRRVQAMAKNLVYPSGCIGLVRYNLISVGFGADNLASKQMSATAVCTNDTYSVISSEKVLEKTYFTADVDVDFDAGTGNISPTSAYIFSNSSEPTYVVTVTTDVNGNISIDD